MKKQWTILLVSATIVFSAFALSGCSGSSSTAASTAASVPSVQVITLQSLDAQSVSGKISANQTVNIYTSIQEKIDSINVDEGSVVKKGQVLVQLDTSSLQQQLKQAEAGVAAAQANLQKALDGADQNQIKAAQGQVEQAQAGEAQALAALNMATESYNRARNNYYELGTITQQQLDQATAGYKSAKGAYDQAQAAVGSAEANLQEIKKGATASTIDALKAAVSSAQANVDLVKVNLKKATITSPINGVVVKKFAQPGEVAFTGMPSGTALLQLVSMDPAQVDVSVSENMINQLKVGQTAAITAPSIPNQKFEGTINFISTVSDPNNNTFPVKLTVKNPNSLLRAGTVVNVFFANGMNTSTIELPKSSIITKNGKSYVYKLEGDTVHLVAVQTTPKDQDWLYLENGSSLKNNDKIVVSPSKELADGMKVNVE